MDLTKNSTPMLLYTAKGTLEEKFLFDDGEKQSRTWKINILDDNNFIANAGDVVGDAKGKQYGNTLRMDYILRTPVGKKTYDLAIEDWIYLIDEKHVINESKIIEIFDDVKNISKMVIDSKSLTNEEVNLVHLRIDADVEDHISRNSSKDNLLLPKLQYLQQGTILSLV